MSVIRLAICLGVLGAFAVGVAASSAQQKANEPFDTFAAIDAKLAALGKHNGEVKEAVAPPQPGKATSTKPSSGVRPWTKAAHDAQQAAKTIKALAGKQEQRYSRLKQSFGARSFGALRERAAAVEEVALALNRNLRQDVAAKQQSILDQRILALVLQYQAITGGYGATHCSSREVACCHPKENSSAQASQTPVACSWRCVSSANSCSGFTGGPTRTSAASGVQKRQVR